MGDSANGMKFRQMLVEGGNIFTATRDDERRKTRSQLGKQGAEGRLRAAKMTAKMAAKQRMREAFVDKVRANDGKPINKEDFAREMMNTHVDAQGDPIVLNTQTITGWCRGWYAELVDASKIKTAVPRR